MTFEERLTIAHQTLADQGIKEYDYNPWMSKLLRKLGCTVKPPYYAGGRAGQFSLCQPQYRADLGSDYVDVRLAPGGKIFRIILVQHSSIRWPVWPRYLDQALAEAQAA